MTDNTTPLQQAIATVKANIGGDLDSDYALKVIVHHLESLLPKEKEFAGKCFDAGYERKQEETDNDWSDGPKPASPDKTKFINQLYPEK